MEVKSADLSMTRFFNSYDLSDCTLEIIEEEIDDAIAEDVAHSNDSLATRPHSNGVATTTQQIFKTEVDKDYATDSAADYSRLVKTTSSRTLFGSREEGISCPPLKRQKMHS